MEKKWSYYGVFFTDKQKASLAKKANAILQEMNVTVPFNWTGYCDHMTIVYNNKSKEREVFANTLNGQIGQEYSLHIGSIGVSDRAIAFGVDNFETQNRQAHITAFVAPGARPVESNDITNWQPLAKGFTIKGKLNVVYKKR